MTVRKPPSGKRLSECYLFGANCKRVRKQFATKGEALSHERYLTNNVSDLIPVDQLRLLLATSALAQSSQSG